ncbi:hypothetical protein [Massilia sp. YIM B04103]|uniref:hypothetical protein n=1 Tax=Massilia sp. YIM B04103 TaxID=2963106 RepID=UPI0021090CFB|nr:hypothetical protein [Massilia sp. YIM B04103]
MENSDMNDEQRRQFIAEVWRRFEAVQDWAIANWPDAQHPLSSSDFVESRKEILSLGLPPGQRLHLVQEQNVPEPEQGGPQYEDVTPAPWP